MVLPIPAVVVLRHPRRGVRVAAAVLALGCAAGIALTTSRGAGVALVLTVLTMVALRELPVRALLVVAAIAAIALVLLPQYATRYARASAILTGPDGTEQVDGAVVGRLSSNIGAVRVWLEHPIVGVGPGNYGQFHKAAVEDLGLRVIPNREPHNLYPHIASESGLLGLVAFTGLVVVTLRGLLRTRRRLRARGDPAIAATGLLFGVIAYLYSGLFLHLSYARYFWMLMALAAVVPLVDPEPDATAPAGDLDPDALAPTR
jgi:putative inorganic carbon (HCO3(-)) transporter